MQINFFNKIIYYPIALTCILINFSGGCHSLTADTVPDNQVITTSSSQKAKNSSVQMDMNGQKYWQHDEGNSYGYFNTFDALKTCSNTNTRKVHILVPRDYNSSNKSYPVVYMNDGQTAFFKDNSVGKTWDLAGTLSKLKEDNSVQDVIIVAVHPIIRDKEYTYTEFADKRQCCELQKYADELTNCIKPFIDKNYRTKSDRKSTAIIGSSHGGLASFYIASRHPETFGYSAALSSSFWAGTDYNYIDHDENKLADSKLIKEVDSTLGKSTHPIFWIDWGMKRDGGTHNSTTERLATKRSKEMSQLLQSKYKYIAGKDLYTYEDKIGGHDEDAWKYRFGLVMKTFFPKSR